jgi:hypothetical protein
MHVLLVCSCSLDFVWYICLVLSMVARIDGGGIMCGSMERIYFLSSSASIV